MYTNWNGWQANFKMVAKTRGDFAACHNRGVLVRYEGAGAVLPIGTLEIDLLVSFQDVTLHKGEIAGSGIKVEQDRVSR